MALLTASAVAAGEVNGNGDPVPGAENGASVCSYSGLNDGNPPAGRTQNFGHTLLFWITMLFIHPSDAPVNPGTACNPS